MSPNLCIAGRRVASECPPFLVAELSGNHQGHLERALALVDAAAAAGADAVKFQTYTADTLTLDHDGPGFRLEAGLWAGRTLYDLYHEAHTPWVWLPALFAQARARGLIAFSSPFDARAVAELERLEAPAFKIASFELVDLPLIRRAAASGRPVLLSTGLATVDEITEAVETVQAQGAPVIILHCVSGYPTPAGDAHLRTIADLAARFACPVGLSDHSSGIAIPVAAVALGATVIEKHLTLSRTEGGVDAAFSLEPAEFRTMAEACRRAWQALGTVTYGPKPSEGEGRAFRRSLYAVADIPAGAALTAETIRSIRPGRGLPPKYLPDLLVGGRARGAIPRGTPLSWEMVEPGSEIRERGAGGGVRGPEEKAVPVSRPRTVIITQARTGSQRLPGKVLLEAAGQPLLTHHLCRLQRCTEADAVVVATTTRPEDDPVAALAASLGVGVFRGDEADVLSRYAGAAAAWSAEIVVRVTSDCPLIDPALIDATVRFFRRETPPLDYAVLDGRAYPRGLDHEVMTRAALVEAAAVATSPVEREHVTPYIYRHPERFRLGVWRDPAHTTPIAGRWCVDEVADYELVRRLLEQVTPASGWQEICKVLDVHPDWADLNRAVVQKTLGA